MPNFNADNAASIVATPQSRNKGNKHHGRVRYFESTYTAPAASAPIIADTITWGTLPLGARIIGSLSSLNCAVGTALCTLNVGDAASAARHLAASSVATAAVFSLVNPANGVACFETTDNTKTATDTCTVRSTVAGAAIAVSQVITLRLAYVAD